jgi:hypothetical protein
MDQETLVEERISDAVLLIRALEELGDKPSAAVWYYFADAEQWRLLVAGETLDDLLPKEAAQAYLKIAAGLRKACVSTLSIGEVKVVRTDDPLLKAGRTLFRTGPDALVRAHFHKQQHQRDFHQGHAGAPLSVKP